MKRGNSKKKSSKPRKTSNKKAQTKIIINSEPWEIRVALINNNRIQDLLVERISIRNCVGNIYKGRVVRVLPGMQAAFVDIGLERTAFLYVSEVYDEMNPYFSEPQDEFDLDDEEISPVQGGQIQDLLKEGQEIVVQVAKAPIGTKGARLTCHVSLPGRSLVLMPTMDHVGISRRIASEQERRRLRDLVTKIKKPGEGVIVRTACEGQSHQALQDDMNYLHNMWKNIQKQAERSRPPKLVYEELNLGVRAVRDLLTPDVDRIVVDDKETYGQIVSFIESFVPKRRGMVELYQGEDPIFDAFRVEHAISRTMDKKVWLKSGGYLIIEQTEALVAIDVNTGRFTGNNKSFEDTIFKTNLEAVEEIVYQLRLRNIGGIIILDFIDMDRASHRDKVYRALEDALKTDKARSKISKITSLGLVEMTRKRTAENIGTSLTQPCPYCEGDGRLKSKTSVCYEIFRALRKEARRIPGSQVHVNVHPEIARTLKNQERQHLKTMESRLDKQVRINKDGSLHLEEFEIHA